MAILAAANALNLGETPTAVPLLAALCALFAYRAWRCRGSGSGSGSRAESGAAGPSSGQSPDQVSIRDPGPTNSSAPSAAAAALDGRFLSMSERAG